MFPLTENIVKTDRHSLLALALTQQTVRGRREDARAVGAALG